MFQRILYPVDPELGAGARAGLEAARGQLAPADSELILLSVLPSLGGPLVAELFPEGAEERMIEEARQRLARFAAELLPDCPSLATLVRTGTPYEEVLVAARECDVDLIVMPARSPSIDRRRMLGSNTFKVVTQAPCAVLVLPQQVLPRS